MSYCPTVLCLCSTWFDQGGLKSKLALGTSAFCNVILSWCSRALYKWVQLGGTLTLGMSAFCNVILSWCSRALYKWVQLGGTLTLGMSAFCNVILSWCSRALYKWAQLAGGSGQLALDTNAFCHRSYCPGGVGLCICELH